MLFQNLLMMLEWRFGNSEYRHGRDTMNPKVREIIAEVSAKHGLQPAQITGPLTTKKVTKARAEAAYRIRTELRPLALNPDFYSYPNIGRMLNRNHATIYTAVQRHAEAIGAAHV